ncbi:hypothetical protein ACSS6W_008045 [Trichoderma asperelloides]
MAFSFIRQNRFSRHFTPRLALSVALIALSTFNYGFDNQGIATSQAMLAYKKQFGDYNPKTNTYAVPTYYLSLLNSLNFIGFAVGLYVGSNISAKYGRRMAMFCMSLWAIMSATVLISATTRGQVLAGRILNYTYIGMELATCPPFQAEIVPAPIRGFAVGTYQTSLLLGGVIINSVCRGTSGLTSNAAWRIPMGLFYIVPITVASCVWFIPESPRWLLLQDREEDALRSLQTLRGSDPSYNAHEDLDGLRLSLIEEHNQGRYSDLFRSTNRRRTLVAMGMNFFIQATGSPFTAAYGTLFVQSIDKIGRRPILMTGSLLQIIWLFTMGGIGTAANPSLTQKQVIVGATALSSASLCFSWDPLNYIVTTELPASRLRDKTQRVASIVNIVTNFLFSFFTPYLLNAPYADLQSKVGFIFGALAICSFLFAYFCVPEMKGRSLEDINEMFDKEVPTRQFGNYVLEHKAEGKAEGKTEIIELETMNMDKPADIHVL